MKRSFCLSPFVQLLAGSVGAQLISVLWSPVLTRLYSPDAFASMALFSATVGIIGNIGALRFEQSIVTRETDELAWVSVVVSFLSLLLSSLTILTAVAIFFQPPSLAVISWELTFGCLLAGCAQVATQVTIRNGTFSTLSKAKVGQVIGVVISSILVSYWIKGLIWSQLLGYVVAILIMHDGVKRLWKQFGIPGLTRTLRAAQGLRHYPLQALLPSLADNLATALPIYYVVGAFSSNLAGQFGMIRQIIGVGVGLVGAALGQVVMKFAADAIRQHAPIGKRIRKYFGFLVITYLPLIAFLFVTGENLVKFIFGNEWGGAGAYSGWVSVVFLGPLLASPFSVLLVALEKLALNGAWQVAHFIGVAVITYGIDWNSLDDFIQWFAVAETVWYIMYLFLIYREVVVFDKNITI